MVLLLIGLSACQGNQEKNRGPQIGGPALNFALQDLKGHTWTLDNCQGQVVLLRFWADWCPSCRFEMPVIEKYYRSLTPSGFQVLAINVKQSAQVAEVFATQMNMSMPVLLDFNGDLARQYRVVALPTNFLIDRQGLIREILIGEVFRDEKHGQDILLKYFPEKQASH
jgi:cytochrome c biogenesis protein CcmG/thiol:disulfide interchange protein DsbE